MQNKKVSNTQISSKIYRFAGGSHKTIASGDNKHFLVKFLVPTYKQTKTGRS